MINRFFTAIRFLTVLPVPGRQQTGEGLAEALPFFPLVGLGLGALTALGALGLQALFPPSVTSVLVVALLLALSGGLHLDGLADTADGFLSSRPPDKILEIMRDSATGAMGAMAVFLVLSLKVTTLASLPPNLFWQAVLLMPLAGRCALLLLMGLLPYARPQGGLATPFYQTRTRGLGAAALFFLGLVCYGVSQTKGLLAAATSLLTILAFALLCRRKINGATGDTLGAGSELAEMTLALGFAIHWP